MTRTGPVIFRFIIVALAGICWCVPALAAADTAARQPSTEKVVWTAPDQEAAKKRAAEVVPFVEAVMDECRLCRQQRLRDMGLSVKDQTESYYLLDSPIIRRTEDHYGPVRFMHAKHATVTKDCALCHHYRPVDESGIGNHTVFGLSPGAVSERSSRAVGAQGRLSSAVHGLSSGDGQGPHRLCRLPPQEHPRP